MPPRPRSWRPSATSTRGYRRRHGRPPAAAPLSGAVLSWETESTPPGNCPPGGGSSAVSCPRERPRSSGTRRERAGGGDRGRALASGGNPGHLATSRRCVRRCEHRIGRGDQRSVRGARATAGRGARPRAVGPFRSGAWLRPTGLTGADERAGGGGPSPPQRATAAPVPHLGRCSRALKLARSREVPSEGGHPGG